jgi:hypothetical protein
MENVSLNTSGKIIERKIVVEAPMPELPDAENIGFDEAKARSIVLDSKVYNKTWSFIKTFYEKVHGFKLCEDTKVALNYYAFEIIKNFERLNNSNFDLSNEQSMKCTENIIESLYKLEKYLNEAYLNKEITRYAGKKDKNKLWNKLFNKLDIQNSDSNNKINDFWFKVKDMIKQYRKLMRKEISITKANNYSDEQLSLDFIQTYENSSQIFKNENKWENVTDLNYNFSAWQQIDFDVHFQDKAKKNELKQDIESCRIVLKIISQIENASEISYKFYKNLLHRLYEVNKKLQSLKSKYERLVLETVRPKNLKTKKNNSNDEIYKTAFKNNQNYNKLCDMIIDIEKIYNCIYSIAAKIKVNGKKSDFKNPLYIDYKKQK